jgi:Cu(I)/Ag(I) efflux system membrane fusion protein
MRRIGLAVAVGGVIAATYIFGAHHQTSKSVGQEPSVGKARRILFYHDPMHPSYKSSKPGIAPDCGMQLVPVYADEAGSKTSSATVSTADRSINVDSATQKLIGLRVATVQKASGTRTLHVVGRVIPEDTRVYELNAGVDGFVRETFNDSVGTIVAKDQKLASYYAPEFLPAASGFLAANERIPGSVTNEGARSIQNYTDRLRNLGMSDPQIHRMAASKQLPESIDIISPVDGVILARFVSPGQHFSHEAPFYKIADLSRVWITAQISQQDQRHLHPGQPVRLLVGPELHTLSAHVTNSLPEATAAGATVELRLEANNPRFLLKPQMVLDVELPDQTSAALTVPVDSVIESGEHARVYVERTEGTFEHREVETGERTSDAVEILKGLEPGDRVVVGATFLVDSESRLKAEARAPGFAN